VLVLRGVSLLLFFVLWWGVSLLNAHVLKVFNPILLPAPDEVLRAGIKMAASGELLKHITASLSRVVWGFGIAAALGIVVGTASAAVSSSTCELRRDAAPHPPRLPAHDGPFVRHRRGPRSSLCAFFPSSPPPSRASRRGPHPHSRRVQPGSE
jgi:hypothetical protein